MGTTRGDFFKYPRTPHLAGSTGTSDDKQLGHSDTARILNDNSLIVEEKLDGTNVGLHFAGERLVLQCRGHEITAGMHPQYDLFKQWATAKHSQLMEMLGERFLMYGEWLFAKHTVHYRDLPHYFFEFDIFDKRNEVFLGLEHRMEILAGTGVHTVPVIHRGRLPLSKLPSLISSSQFNSQFDNPLTRQTDNLMEGIYLRTEANGMVMQRAKYVRAEFTEKVKQSSHWQYEKMVQNRLSDSADIWS